MLGGTAATLFLKSIEGVSKGASAEHGRASHIVREIISYPIKTIAAFLTAPFLMIRIAWTVKNPIRRIVAVIGLLLALALAYGAGGFLGTMAGTFFVGHTIGVMYAAGFLVGTTASVILSLIFSIIVFNAVSFLFLKMSAQEVIDYLKEISE